MTWFLHALLITTSAWLAGAVAAIALLFFKRWTLAHRVAQRATLIAVVVLGVVVAELQVLWTAPGLVAPLLVRVLPPGDPGTRARALAEGISEIMNCSALVLPAAVLGGTSEALHGLLPDGSSSVQPRQSTRESGGSGG